MDSRLPLFSYSRSPAQLTDRKVPTEDIDGLLPRGYLSVLVFVLNNVFKTCTLSPDSGLDNQHTLLTNYLKPKPPSIPFIIIKTVFPKGRCHQSFEQNYTLLKLLYHPDKRKSFTDKRVAFGGKTGAQIERNSSQPGIQKHTLHTLLLQLT